jgi:hypothetical protein
MLRMSDDLAPITFERALLCGLAGCDAQTTTGLLERDQHLSGLWRLLPVCPRCLSGLRSGSRLRLREHGVNDPQPTQQ